MNPEDRFVLPFDRNFTSNAEIPSEPIGSVEDVSEDGEVRVRALMIGTDTLFVEAFKGKGTVDPMHVHEDHESIVYLLSGRMRLVIDGEEFVAERGDVWRHPRGVPHTSEALEDSIQLETKSPPRKTWYTDNERKGDPTR